MNIEWPLKTTMQRLLAGIGIFANADLWAVAIYEGASPVDLAPAEGVLLPAVGARDVTDLDAICVADPFMLKHGEEWHMFFEVVERATRRGRIAIARSRDGRRWRYGQVVLAEPFHLSYPQVFTWDGSHYMVPETGSQECVVLYRAVDYPQRWIRDSVLLQGAPFSDATLFRHAGRWWILVESSGRVPFETLRVFHADALRGPWVEHPMSPVVTSDGARARPAGRVVSWNGRLLRFAQDCRTVYGLSVSAFEIVHLDEHRYVEQPYGAEPVLAAGAHPWSDLGMHHVDAHEIAPGRWIACVDGRPRVGLRKPPRIPAAQRVGLLAGRA